jgi:hypothetical protein
MLATALGLAGCVTTQQKNARTLLLNARTLASEARVRVTRETRDVKVVRIELVRGVRGASDAVAVLLRNVSGRPLTDLPISVGITMPGGHLRYLNGRANIDYYDTHVPAIPADASVSWVLPGVRLTKTEAARMFAEVGAARPPASTSSRTLPRIEAARAGGALSEPLRVAVANDSGVPQYGLQVYAVAVRNGRYVGAARAALTELDGGSRATIGLPLIGTASGATVALYAPPTIFK